MAKKTAKKSPKKSAPKRSAGARTSSAKSAVSPRRTTKEGSSPAKAVKPSGKILEKAREILEEEQRKLSQRLGKLDTDGESNVGDIADAATQQEARAVMQGLQATERDQLRQVEDALKKIAEGTYGLCERCENPIEAARLEAIPYVKTCISCKRKEETGGFTPAARTA